MMRWKSSLLSSLLLMLVAGGCTHSHIIEMTVTNTSSEKVSNVAIEYPEASFGINSLAAGQSYQYKIKPTSTGPLKIGFLNSHAQDRTSTGPVLHKDDEGSIEIKITQDGATSEKKIM